ncbi:MAG TPA: cytochrome c [Candidatus Angelobacter sp.]|jgi:cytochrome c5|nr:cytochrome c [Candidatus Angelobacter sp.]
MKMKFALPIVFLAGAISLSLAAFAGTSSKDGSKDASSTAAPTATAPAVQDENLHLEGEQRFRANCARCHAAPPKFSPRMMATIVRHMRVRAIITDQDMHLILRYMTE